MCALGACLIMHEGESALWLSGRDQTSDPRNSMKLLFESAAQGDTAMNDAILCNKLRIVIDALRKIQAYDTDPSPSKYGLSPNPDAVEGIENIIIRR